ncbi:glucose-1-phosphate cytidylyltransferase [Roseovarius sp.]|uniref:glucose-1-phosphate cytidylyltransferase n=1 Tax=Roseovarius sp. TaxID=1486281 RepID=UPI00356AD021
MKVIILAGGLGTRLSEETVLRPKPMVEIGGKPILWHIMKTYSAHGFNDFIICLGYRGHIIKEYFANYSLYNADVTIDLQANHINVHQRRAEPWNVTLVDTGSISGTGGRLRRIRKYLDDEPFCFTYGDAVSDIDIGSLVQFHKERDRLVTVTAIQPASRYGILRFDDDLVTQFREKPAEEATWINGGFFVVSPKAIDYIENDETNWEHEPLPRLVEDKQVSIRLHGGFWQCMDTLRDKNHLEQIWESGRAPWKVWGD